MVVQLKKLDKLKGVLSSDSQVLFEVLKITGSPEGQFMSNKTNRGRIGEALGLSDSRILGIFKQLVGAGVLIPLQDRGVYKLNEEIVVWKMN